MARDTARFAIDAPLPAAARDVDHTAASPCNRCGDRNGTLFVVKDRLGAALNVTRCKACGLNSVDPLPSVQELAALYAQRHRREYKSAAAPRIRHVCRAALARLAGWLKRRGDQARAAAAPPSSHGAVVQANRRATNKNDTACGARP